MLSERSPLSDDVPATTTNRSQIQVFEHFVFPPLFINEPKTCFSGGRPHAFRSMDGVVTYL